MSPKLQRPATTAADLGHGERPAGAKQQRAVRHRSGLPRAKKRSLEETKQLLASLTKSLKQMNTLNQVLDSPRRHSRRPTDPSHRGSLAPQDEQQSEQIEDRHLRLVKAELEAEREERMKIEKANADLHMQIGILQKRVLKEQEKTKMFPKVTSIVPTSLEANIHLRHQFQKGLENEREKYAALELENQRLVQQIRDISMANFKSKRALSIQETTQHANEVAFWRNKVKELEGDKEVLREKLSATERQLAKETKEKERIFKEMVTMRRLQMHLSNRLDSASGQSSLSSSTGVSQANIVPEFDDELTAGYLRSIGVSVKRDSEPDVEEDAHKDTMAEAIKRAKSAVPKRSSIKPRPGSPGDGARLSVTGEARHVRLEDASSIPDSLEHIEPASLREAQDPHNAAAEGATRLAATDGQDKSVHELADASASSPAARGTHRRSQSVPQEPMRLRAEPAHQRSSTAEPPSATASGKPARKSQIKKAEISVLAGQPKARAAPPLIDPAGQADPNHLAAPANPTFPEEMPHFDAYQQAATAKHPQEQHGTHQPTNESRAASDPRTPTATRKTGQTKPATASSDASEAKDLVPENIPHPLVKPATTAHVASQGKARRSRQPSEDSIRAAKIQLEYDAYVTNKDDTHSRATSAADSPLQGKLALTLELPKLPESPAAEALPANVAAAPAAPAQPSGSLSVKLGRKK